jgi:hypothetical protein
MMYSTCIAVFPPEGAVFLALSLHAFDFSILFSYNYPKQLIYPR